ncbi:MAG: transporter permease [Rhodospirillales bacterium]|nr:transporter permease [Rhodospirillales bacterium]
MIARVLRLGDRLAPLLTLVAIVVVWEIACRLLHLPAFVLPAPSAIVLAGENLGVAQWREHFVATLQIVVVGYAVSIAISVPLAVALTSSRFLSRTVYPLLVVIQSTPIVAVAPIIVVTLGVGMLPRVVITCMVTFFPLVIGTATGLRATPEELIELSRSLRAGRWREFTQIRLPFAIPYIFSALKVSVTLSVIGAVIAEFVAAEKGLGFLILFSTSLFKVPQAFAALGILVAASLVLYHLVVLAERLLFPWSLPKEAQSG